MNGRRLRGMFLVLAAITIVPLLVVMAGCQPEEPAAPAPTPTTPAPTPTPTPTPTAPTPPTPTTSAPTPAFEPGEDLKFTGPVQSIGADSWTIGGKKFSVTAGTILDRGLAVGATATVEFMLQADGSMVAKQIETPGPDDRAGEDFHFTGAIESITAGTYVIGGQTFKTNASTVLDTGLVVGATATVEFTLQADGAKLAKEIETKAKGVEAGEDFKFTGAIESIGADSWKIGGKTFSVTAGTILDRGLAVGVTATVEFMLQADGSMVAKEIETPAPDDQADGNVHFSGAIESVSAGVYVIGGQTFKTDASTVLDTGLVVGAPARVEFVIQADGAKLAKEIQTP